MSMTIDEARAALKQLGISQVKLAEDLRSMTGSAYHTATVNKWFKNRPPSDVCVVYLKMALRLQALEKGASGTSPA